MLIESEIWTKRELTYYIEKGWKGNNNMLVAKKEVSKRSDILNKKPMIRKSQSTGEMVAGFLDPESGAFEVAMEINDERDIDEFLEEYDLSVVMISKM